MQGRAMQWVRRASVLLALALVGGTAKLAAQVQTQSQTFVMRSGEDSWLGVEVQDVTAASAKELGLPGVYGAIVESVEPNSPAAKSGIQKKDVIFKYAGERVFSAATLTRLVKETPPGRTVTVEVSRDGAVKDLQATIEKPPEGAFSFNGRKFYFNGKPYSYNFGPLRPLTPQAPKAMPLPNPQSPWPEFNFRLFSHPVLGITGEDLTSQLAKFFGVTQGKGVLVTEVTAGSPAARAGIKAGDVITKVNSKEVGSLDELRTALGEQSSGPRKVELTIIRNREEQMVTVNLESYPEGMQTTEAWKNLGISPQDADSLAALTAEPKLKAAQYQKDFQVMQEQLKQQLQPLKDDLQREMELLKARTHDEIQNRLDLERQSQAARVI